MRWVKETLPPRARARLELMTTRLSISSFAGTARTVVAVGTLRLWSMLVAIALAGPRSTETVSSSVFALGVDLGSWAGMGADFGAAAFGAGAWAAGAGWAAGAAETDTVVEVFGAGAGS